MLKSMFVYRALYLALALSIIGCSQNEPEGYTHAIVEGIIEHSYDHVQPPVENPYAIELETVFGQGQGADSYIIGMMQWAAIARTDDGGLVISDGRQDVIHRFDKNGQYLGQFSGPGEGPGEFSLLRKLIAYDGKIVTWDSRNYQLCAFDQTGHLQSALRIATPKRAFCVIPWQTENNIEYLAYHKVTTSIRQDGEVEGTRAYIFTVYTLDVNGKVIDTPIDTVSLEQRALTSPRPFNTPFLRGSTSVAMQPGLPLAWSSGSDYEINLFHPTSGIQEHVRILRDQKPVTNELRELIIQSYASRGQEEGARRSLKYPETLPQIDILMWDSEDRLWVRDFVVWQTDHDNYTYNVFSVDMEWLFRQTLPAKEPYLICGDGIYVYAPDDEGVPMIEYYRFIKP